MSTLFSEEVMEKSLNSIGFNLKAKVHCCFGGPVLGDNVINELLQFVESIHSEQYANKASNDFIEDNDERIEKEKSCALSFLMHEKRCFDFFLLTPIPIIVEYKIAVQNGKKYEINKLLIKRILNDVNEENNEMSFNEIANDLRILYGGDQKHYYYFFINVNELIE